MKIKVEGKVYWLNGEKIEVEVNRYGYQRSWLKINPEGQVGKKVKAAAAKARKLAGYGGGEGLEAKAIEAGVAENWLGMWRRGSMSDEMLMILIEGGK